MRLPCVVVAPPPIRACLRSFPRHVDVQGVRVEAGASFVTSGEVGSLSARVARVLEEATALAKTAMTLLSQHQGRASEWEHVRALLDELVVTADGMQLAQAAQHAAHDHERAGASAATAADGRSPSTTSAQADLARMEVLLERVDEALRAQAAESSAACVGDDAHVDSISRAYYYLLAYWHCAGLTSVARLINEAIVAAARRQQRDDQATADATVAAERACDHRTATAPRAMSHAPLLLLSLVLMAVAASVQPAFLHGCFIDRADDRVFVQQLGFHTMQECGFHCKTRGFKHMALEYPQGAPSGTDTECWCGVKS
ncbi:hypothetical protein FOA52_009941 [Chlamydomonas sp. UWO 241]|nr:hypothetical protein FOA52_009941 [Chlamydomonas sp. UWO 241]